MIDPCIELTQVSSNVLALAGGFLGGTSMLFYMRPKDMQDGIRRIVISSLSAVMLTGITAHELFGVEGSQAIMGTAFGIGFIAWSLLGGVAKFFAGRQDQDIVQMMKAVNEVRTPAPQPFYPYNIQQQSKVIDNPDA